MACPLFAGGLFVFNKLLKQLKNKKAMRNSTFTGSFYGETITVKQIQKRTAKKLFESGETVYIQACNMRPFNAWFTCVDINKEKADGETFESIVNSFEYYNCSRETGLYTTFYKRIS